MSAMRSSKAVIQTLVILFALVSGAPASATVVTAIDEFIIVRSGVAASSPDFYDGRTVFYRDSFNDGLAPTSGGQFFTGTPGTYKVLGSYPAGAESAGRLTIDSSHGGGFVISSGGNYLLQRSVLPTDTNPATQDGLKRDFHTFAIYGRFDLVIPPMTADGYGISINDDGATGESTALNLFMRRELNGNVVIRFEEEDFVDDIAQILERDVLDVPIGADQIEFRLGRDSLTTNEIIAAYRFWDNGTPMSAFTTMTATADFFTRREWARGAFFAVQAVPVPEPSTLVLLVLAGLAAAGRRKQ